MKKLICILPAIFIFVVIASNAFAESDIGKIVALRGRAVIERNQKALDAKLKDGVQLIDAVATKEASKTKMLFIDDSVLTVGENSRVVIKEFVYSKDERGRAIFNLIDGKMRSVVGKTNFEVHTPTLVAAARGTVIYFEVGMIDGKVYTTVISLEGEVIITSVDPSVTGRVVLTPGMMITVTQNGATLPAPSHAPAGMMQAAAMTREAGPARVEPALTSIGDTIRTVTSAPQILQQPPQALSPLQPSTTTPVNVGIVFPGTPAPPSPPATTPVNVGIVFP